VEPITIKPADRDERIIQQTVMGQSKLTKDWDVVFAYTPPVGAEIRLHRLERMSMGFGLCEIKTEYRSSQYGVMYSRVYGGLVSDNEVQSWDYQSGQIVHFTSDNTLLVWGRLSRPKSWWRRLALWLRRTPDDDITLVITAYIESMGG
jgi:hypothetical protein